MSGGHFEYDQHRIGRIAESIDAIILNNQSDSIHGKKDVYSDETIAKFKLAIKALKEAEVYAQRVDWLVSGDDGEPEFHKRLAEDLKGLI